MKEPRPPRVCGLVDARCLGLLGLFVFGCAAAQTRSDTAPSFREAGEIHAALQAASVHPDLRVEWTGRGSRGAGWVYRTCEDGYAYGDLPGHPSDPCVEQTEFFVRARDGGWQVEQIEPPAPLFFDCFPFIQLWGGPWEDAEVGRSIPLGGRMPS